MAGLKVHTVTDGDSLPSVAYKNYGDATRWRTIAEANGIDDPLSLRRGQPAVDPEPRDLMPALHRRAALPHPHQRR